MMWERTRRGETAGALLTSLAVLVGIQGCNIGEPVAADGEANVVTAGEQPAVAQAGDARGEEGVLQPANESIVRLREAIQQVDESAAREQSDLSAEPAFTPMTRRPEILNRTEVMAAMEREYPPLLRNAGIGGTIRVYFFITEEGEVRNTLVAETSGHRALDEGALRIADVYRFSPAYNGDDAVPVWVQFGITFRPS